MKYIPKTLIWIVVCLLSCSITYAQKAERKNLREGNKLFKNEQYTEAEIVYRKSLEVNPRSLEGSYNLGNALYKQGKFPEAAQQYQLIAEQSRRLLEEGNPEDIQRLSEVFHNLGNIGMANQDYARSVEAYKQSLRLNPKDDETRYNLALAQKLLEDQEGDGGGGQDDQQDDQNEDNQDNNDDQQPQDQPQQQDDQQENQTQEEPQQNEQMSQDNAQQILDAFLQDEKDTQEKVKQAQQQQQQRRRTDKEW